MNRLQSELRRIDHSGYPAYKDLRGSYDFGKYILNIEHIQGDPFASPSSLSVKIKGKAAGFPKEYYNGYDRKTAFEDFILRRFSFLLQESALRQKVQERAVWYQQAGRGRRLWSVVRARLMRVRAI